VANGPRSSRLNYKGKLRQLYKGDDADYTKFFDYIAQREHQGTIEVDTIMEVIVGPYRADAIMVARTMEEIGLGKFIIGRRGSPTRLEWFFRSDSVGQLACGDIDELLSLEGEDEGSDEMEEPVVGVWQIVHSFRLRPDESVRFQLPSNLTQQEAGRLSDFIKSLPFE